MSFDAIVVGSGISGGWAAKELCERGHKTLLIERGRKVVHGEYPTALKHPWEFPNAGQLTHDYKIRNPIASKAWLHDATSSHFYTEDSEQPYVQVSPFDWIRGYQLGGKSLTWGRASQRWSQNEFDLPARQGYGIKWPISYDEIAPWYAHVEEFVGICGGQDGIPSMPDGNYLPPFPLNCVEQHMQKALEKSYPDRRLVSGRWAHLSEPTPLHLSQNRGKCQSRNRCVRGCPLGGYFSSVSSTIPWAEKTGNLSLRTNAVVEEIIYDEQEKRAIGVKMIDTITQKREIIEARIIFLNASTLNTNLILLNSRSNRFPNGLGNDHNILGKYICFHNYRPSVYGYIDGFDDKYIDGKKPSGPIIPNYKNFLKDDAPFKGSFMTFAGAIRQRNNDPMDGSIGIGEELKTYLSRPGPWVVYMYMQGETIPIETNQVSLDDSLKDPYGVPQLKIDVNYTDNDEAMILDFIKESKKMMELIGCRDIIVVDNKQNPGLDIHEMGGVRMGLDPASSMLNGHNQLHSCQNVFVTDGACMASTGNQSPSILYMALTARAASYASNELNNGRI